MATVCKRLGAIVVRSVVSAQKLRRLVQKSIDVHAHAVAILRLLSPVSRVAPFRHAVGIGCIALAHRRLTSGYNRGVREVRNLYILLARGIDASRSRNVGLHEVAQSQPPLCPPCEQLPHNRCVGAVSAQRRDDFFVRQLAVHRIRIHRAEYAFLRFVDARRIAIVAR